MSPAVPAARSPSLSVSQGRQGFQRPELKHRHSIKDLNDTNEPLTHPTGRAPLGSSPSHPLCHERHRHHSPRRAGERGKLVGSEGHRNTRKVTVGIESQERLLTAFPSARSRHGTWGVSASLQGAGVLEERQPLSGPNVLFSVCRAAPGWSSASCSRPRCLWEPFAGHIVS